MKRFLLLMLIPIFLAACSTTKENKTIDTNKYFTTSDMVKLDQVYVPALFLTNKDERIKSQKAIEKLETTWNIFKTNNYEILNDTQKEKFDEISDVIVEAKSIAANTNMALVDAHEELEAVRDILFEIRKELGIIYYMDSITEFHTIMEEAIEAKNDTSKLKEHLIALNSSLDKLESFNFDYKLYQFSEEKNIQRLEIIKAERTSIKNLETAIENNNVNEKLVLAIKPNFIKLFLLFGNN